MPTRLGGHLKQQGWAACELFVVLLFAVVTCIGAVDAQGSSASIDGQKEEETGTVTGEPSMFPTELTTQSISTVKARTTQGSHTSSTRFTILLSTKRTSVSPEKRAGVEMDNYQGIFYYDEKSLRKWGLVAAAILFILGILILTCGKHGKLLRCRGKKRARNYEVSQP